MSERADTFRQPEFPTHSDFESGNVPACADTIFFLLDENGKEYTFFRCSPDPDGQRTGLLRYEQDGNIFAVHLKSITKDEQHCDVSIRSKKYNAAEAACSPGGYLRLDDLIVHNPRMTLWLEKSPDEFVMLKGGERKNCTRDAARVFSEAFARQYPVNTSDQSLRQSIFELWIKLRSLIH